MNYDWSKSYYVDEYEAINLHKIGIGFDLAWNKAGDRCWHYHGFYLPVPIPNADRYRVHQGSVERYEAAYAFI